MARPTRRIRNADDLREHRNDARMGIGGQSAPPVPSVAVAVLDGASRAAARPVNAVTGGQGGTVLLIAGILFVAYLFVTRRLQRVVGVLAEPAPGIGGGPISSSPSVVSSARPARSVGGTGGGGGGGGTADAIRQAEQAREREEERVYGPRDYKRDPRPSYNPRDWKWEDPSGRPSPPPGKGLLPGGYYLR